ncbi:MAG: hypothetical protein ACKPKO_02025, partial [Candidatus Fonsibacter sp.]
MYFKPTTERARKLKFEEPVCTGVFAGYQSTPGYSWSGIYIIWKLDDFQNIDLRQYSPIVDRRRIIPYLVRELTIDAGDIFYPLKSEYEMLNNTLEGVSS